MQGKVFIKADPVVANKKPDSVVTKDFRLNPFMIKYGHDEGIGYWGLADLSGPMS